MLKQSLGIAGVFTAIILGAGFASGRELMNFFVVFGRGGFLGIITAGIVFALVGVAVMKLCLSLGVGNYSEFSQAVFGNFFGLVMEVIIACFMFVLFSTMLAASAAVLNESLGMPDGYGAAVMCGLCFILFRGGMRRVAAVSAALAPVMIIGGIFVGLLFAAPAFAQHAALHRRHWFVSALVYASYNIITAVTVLAGMGGRLTRKSAFWGPVLGAAAITVLGICMSLPLFSRLALLSDAELPLLRLASERGGAVNALYTGVLLSAIATTAAANGFAFAEWLSRRLGIMRLVSEAGVCVCGLLAAGFGFSGFVAGVYPVFGYAGFFQITVILLTYLLLIVGKCYNIRRNNEGRCNDEHNKRQLWL